MVRTQIQLTAEQARDLKKVALSGKGSVSELIRRAVDELVKSKSRTDAEEMKKRALAVVGKYHSGKKEISRKHDAYLAGAFEK